jgi:hypothetical protein
LLDCLTDGWESLYDFDGINERHSIDYSTHV